MENPTKCWLRRSGESKAMGMIDKVSYRIAGTDVLMTYEDGMAKGTTMRFTMTGPDAASAENALHSDE